MSYEAFSSEWSRACCEQLNARGVWARVAGGWQEPVVLIMRADPGSGERAEKAVFLDLSGGRCQDARPASPADHERATYVLAAGAGVWNQLLRGELDPISAVMQGKLRLERGALFSLIPHADAARELLAAAASVETHFSDTTDQSR